MTPLPPTGIARFAVPRRSRMRRKRLLISLGLILGFVLLVLLGLASDGQARAELLPPGKPARGIERQQLSKEMMAKSRPLAGSLYAMKTSGQSLSERSAKRLFPRGLLRYGGDDNLPKASPRRG